MFADAISWAKLSTAERAALMQRPALNDDQSLLERTAEIITRVRAGGDSALFAFSSEFDSADLESLQVSPAEFSAADHSLPASAKEAIDFAIRNVRRFHNAQVPTEIDMLVSPGVRCERRNRAIDAVGLYVPAGSAPLPSAAIMLAVPAYLANCPTRILCTPPQPDGTADAATLYAAWQSGVQVVFKIGGAQAIAAMSYGTQTVPKVDKIFGPGNTWVTAAKRLVAADPEGAAIDMPAGPSEVLVIADESADAAFVAADLLSQAEHGADSQVVLITIDAKLAGAIASEVERQLLGLSRQSIARAAMGNSLTILANNIRTAVEISNRYAPEHLILQTKNARDMLQYVRNAGSVFIGPWSPEAVGDYCSGTNHVLPTYGSARSFSGLGVEQFLHQITVQELSFEGLRSVAGTVTELASLEGLDAHANAVNVRFGRKLAARSA